jgi:hypothetical protein
MLNLIWNLPIKVLSWWYHKGSHGAKFDIMTLYVVLYGSAMLLIYLYRILYRQIKNSNSNIIIFCLIGH